MPNITGRHMYFCLNLYCLIKKGLGNKPDKTPQSTKTVPNSNAKTHYALYHHISGTIVFQ